MEKVRIVIANPSGNITLFVLDYFPRGRYAEIAKKLLAITELKGQQVAFILPDSRNVDGSFEMCGLEFCGNASRSFALLTALNSEKDGNILIKASGCDNPLVVEVDKNNNYAKADMPLPNSVFQTTTGTFVEFDGIVHFVTHMFEPTQHTFDKLKDDFYSKKKSPAFGVMFLNDDGFIPIVYVRDIDTTYFEGSCGSGTIAAAITLSLDRDDGEYRYKMKQPEGTLDSTVTVSNGKISKVTLEGYISLSDILSVEI